MIEWHDESGMTELAYQTLDQYIPVTKLGERYVRAHMLHAIQ